MMDLPTNLFPMIIAGVVAGVLIPPSRKLLDLAYRMCSLQMRKINEERNYRIQNKNEAENAVRDALKSWDYAEEFREKGILKAKAFGGYYPTIQAEIECWENVVAKCRYGAELLEVIDKERSSTFRNNASMASRKIEELEKHPGKNTRTYSTIGEAARREYEEKYGAELAHNYDEDFDFFRIL